MPNRIFAQIDGRKFDYYVRNLTVQQSPGLHDVAKFEFQAPGGMTRMSRFSGVPEGAPITVAYGGDATNRTQFFGYVHHFEVLSTSPSYTRVRCVCVGTSLPFDNQRVRSWSGRTPTAIVKEITEAHGFRTIMSSGARLLDFYPQPGISDAQVINNLARDIGYRAWISADTCFFVDPAVLISKVSERQVLRFTVGPEGTGGTCQSFVTTSGQLLDSGDGASGQRSISGLLRGTTAAVTATASGAADLQLVDTSRVVETADEAKQAVEAGKARSQFWRHAEALVDGNVRLRPGRVVFFSGSGISPTDAGVWLVRSVIHNVDLESRSGRVFQSLVNLERNGDSLSLKPSPGARNSYEPGTPSILGAGQWRAKVAEVLYV